MSYITDLKLRFPDDYIGVTRGFTSSHRGVDLGWNAAHGGQNCGIFAPADGVVTAVCDGMGNTWNTGVSTWGNYVKIDHGSGVYTLMAHLLNGSVTAAGMRPGVSVKRGQAIGKMNNSGYSNGSHLHYEVYLGGAGTNCRVDPLPYTYVYPGQTVSPNTACKEQIKYMEDKPLNIVGNPAERDTSKDQIEIAIDNLRARTGAYLMDNVVGYIRPGIYDVLEIKDVRYEQSNGYLWYRVHGSLWCAHIDGSVSFYRGQEKPPVDPLQLAVNQAFGILKPFAEPARQSRDA